MKNLVKKFLVFLILISSQPLATFGQDTSRKVLPLKDLSAFQDQAGNWRIVGQVAMDPSVDIHQKAEESNKKRKKKKKGKEQEQAHPQAVSYQPGTGILLNLNDESLKDNLVTNFEHGDIELEMDVMLPKGSNSGLYLQGRYEVQLFDSWGVTTPKFSDMGGIYRNWESAPGKIYMGKAPLANASKAPGLWQTIRLLFKAPRFDEKGNKIENAKFVYVDLNGVRIHDNIEVPLPTGGPIENNEKPMGPIMIQGDHGPVAIRNFRYKLIHDLDVRLSDIAYTVYHGDFKSFNDLSDAKPAFNGKSDELTYRVAAQDDGYAIVFKGKLHVPESGSYVFDPEVSGGLKLVVNGKQVVNYNRTDGMLANNPSSIQLDKGVYDFELVNVKNIAWRSPRLGLFVKKPDTHAVPLHAFSSNPPDNGDVAPVYVDVENQPKLLRAFIDFKGQRNQRITHSIGVGGPNGMHYVYDLKKGNLVCVWRGDFVNATPMWHDRGDGSFRPMGAVQYLLNNQQLAVLESNNSSFPSSNDPEDFHGLGYIIEEAGNRPVFKYKYKNISVTDRIYPGDMPSNFVREVSIENPDQTAGLFFKLAEGKNIEPMDGGYYAIDDKQYYIQPLSGQTPSVRKVNDRKELILPVDGNSIKYSIIW